MKAEIIHDDWLSARRFALLLALLILATFPQVLLGLQTFVYRDFGIFSYPLAAYFRDRFWHGEIPLWNPLNNCGIPFLAQWNTQVLYPPALFYLIFPLSWSLGVFCLLHLFWGGLGMFLLARDWSRNSLAAAFAGIVFAFNGLMLGSLIWPGLVAALGWMPWVVRFTEQAQREGGKKIVIAAFIGALQMLTGGTEVVLLTWIISGTLALRLFLGGEIPRAKIFLRMTVIVALISGLCAAQLLPFFELLQASRQQQEISAATWPMPATGLVNFFVPLFHGHFLQGVFIQDHQSWINSYYVGGTTMLLAMGAFCLGGKTRWLMALVAFCLVLAVGEATPIYGWLSKHVGVIGLIRFPVKFVIVPIFVLPLLAALALSKKIRVQEKLPRLVLFSIWLAVVAFMLGVLGWQWRSETPDAIRTTILLNGLTRIFFFTAMVGVWFLANKISAFKPRWLCQFLLLLLAWLDLSRQMPLPQTVSREIYQPQLSRTLPLPQAGFSRAMIPAAARDVFYHSILPDAATDYLGRRYAFFADCNLLENAPKCDGFYPLYLTDYALLFYNFYRDDQPAEPFLDFLGVSQKLERQTNQFVWTPRTTFLPMLSCGQKPFFADDFSTLQNLTNANFQPGREVFLPPEAKAFITASNFSTASLSGVHYAAQKIEAAVTTAEPTLAVLAQTYYSPWRAYVDGRPVKLWRANYAFQALEIPVGQHQLKVVYEDRQFYLGTAISLTTLAGCLIFYCRNRRASATV